MQRPLKIQETIKSEGEVGDITHSPGGGQKCGRNGVNVDELLLSPGKG